MTTLDIANLINLLGWAMGLALYAMLLLMALRSTKRAPNKSPSVAPAASWNRFDALPLATAMLGLMWNVGALATRGLHSFGVGTNPPDTSIVALLGAASVSALGFLPAVVVHSAAQNLRAEENWPRTRLLTFAAYSLSTLATLMHFARAVVSQEAYSQTALHILTAGFALLTIGLFLSTRGEAGWRRAVWGMALAVFAVSALHLSTSAYGTNHERWYLELIGHHASLPLALAILYQDYRFAFADLFLKRALALLAFVALTTGAFLLYATWLVPVFAPGDVAATGDHPMTLNARAVGILIALWAATGMLYPQLARATNWFVEKIVLGRTDYAELRSELARTAHAQEGWEAVLDGACARLAAALNAREVSWREIKASDDGRGSTVDEKDGAGAFGELVTLPARRDAMEFAGGGRASAVVRIPVADAPRYEIVIGELAGGRRLLSDDIEMLEAIAVTLARRIDALRVTHERCEQTRREQEIAKLATEAQLRALRSQVNPHFLFNALTTVGYLIQASPQRALETLMRLTELLRRVLRATDEWVTLGEELKLVEAYLDIERARFEERLRVRVNVAPELRGFLVPSFVVQPLVENAVKHGIAPQRAGGEVRIDARLDRSAGKQTLVITVRDTGAGAGAEQLRRGRLSGVGLANVEARLQALCGDEAQLGIETAAGTGATVEMRLPARAAQVSSGRRFSPDVAAANAEEAEHASRHVARRIAG